MYINFRFEKNKAICMPSFAINPFYRWKLRSNVRQPIDTSSTRIQHSVGFYRQNQVLNPKVKMSDFVILLCIHLQFDLLFFPSNSNTYCSLLHPAAAVQRMKWKPWLTNFHKFPSHQTSISLRNPTSLNQTQSPGRKSPLETLLWLWDPRFSITWGTVKGRV